MKSLLRKLFCLMAAVALSVAAYGAEPVKPAAPAAAAPAAAAKGGVRGSNEEAPAPVAAVTQAPTTPAAPAPVVAPAPPAAAKPEAAKTTQSASPGKKAVAGKKAGTAKAAGASKKAAPSQGKKAASKTTAKKASTAKKAAPKVVDPKAQTAIAWEPYPKPGSWMQRHEGFVAQAKKARSTCCSWAIRSPTAGTRQTEAVGQVLRPAHSRQFRHQRRPHRKCHVAHHHGELDGISPRSS